MSEHTHPAPTIATDPHAVPADAAKYLGQAKRNLQVGVVLAIGASVTVALSFVSLSTSAHVLVALVIAIVLSGIVAMVSMHLKEERAEVVRAICLTVFMVLVLFVISHLAFADHIHM